MIIDKKIFSQMTINKTKFSLIRSAQKDSLKKEKIHTVDHR